jgi:AcrR family transcriptional regulator
MSTPPLEDRPGGPIERKLRADAERNRRRILVAAAEVFAERGLHATMDEVAERAGVGVGTVYRRFPNRDELIQALFEDRLEQFVALTEACLADPDPWGGLVAFLERTLELQAADRGLKELLHRHAHVRSEDRLPQIRERVEAVLDQLLERARAAGQLRADVVATDLPMISIMIGAAADLAQAEAPELWRRYLLLVIDGLRERRDAPTPLTPPALGVPALDRAMAAWKPARR